ncbi:Putative SET domain, AWS domain-containing protein [Septoria linicola]|uniref:SET domain, AWS domain-containing protein n=1 Tax=Septoria linicola TaxID=215465 RepID=A0A9Q9EGA1_9PEZI|nr:putative SET domain, AWS domain-containing protein [Septoria linicola]USW50611.1 Putative SET domain, AWS domain-containing protein [Septoria linicola]
MVPQRETLTRTSPSSDSALSNIDVTGSAMDLDDASEHPAASTPPTSVGDDRSTHSAKAGNEVGEQQEHASGGRAKRSRVSINYNVKHLLDAQASERTIESSSSSSKVRKASGLSGRTLVEREQTPPDELENEDIDVELEDDLEKMLARTPQKGKAPAKKIERRPSMKDRAKKAATVLGKRTRDMVEAGKKKLGLVEEQESPKKTKLLKELDMGPKGFLDEIDLDEEREAPRPVKRAKTTKAPERDLAPVTIANPMQKTSSGSRVKKWQVQGLYAGQEMDFDSNKPASKQKKKLQKNRPESSASAATVDSEVKPKKKHLNFNLPMFGYLDEDKTRSFRIPYDVYAPHNNKKMDEKPKDWHKLNKNRLVGDAKDLWQKEEKLQPSFCSCKTPDQLGAGCDDDCLNRVMQYECDDRNCRLGADECSNRPFHELAARLKKGGLFDIGVEVVKTEQRGHGIRAARSFKPGQIIMEYTGEIITEEECQLRMSTTYLNKPCYYLMEMERGLVLDGTKGSAARFINHACDPNCEVRMTKVNGVPRMGIYAGPSGIMTNEELSYDYNFDNFGDTRQICYCGSQNCRGYLGKRLRADQIKKLAKEEQERLRIVYEEAQKRAQQEARKKQEHDDRGSGWRGWLAVDDPEVKAQLKEEKRLKEEAEKNSSRAQRLAARRGSPSARPRPAPAAPKAARKKAEPKPQKAVVAEEVSHQNEDDAHAIEEESDEDMKVDVVKNLSRPKHTRTTSTGSKFTENIDLEDRPTSKASSRPASRRSGIIKKTTVSVKTSAEIERTEKLEVMVEDTVMTEAAASELPSLADELTNSNGANLSKVSSEPDTIPAIEAMADDEAHLVNELAPKAGKLLKRSNSVRDRVKQAFSSVSSGTKTFKQSTLNFAKLS